MSDCDREASIMSRPGPPRGCRAIGKKKKKKFARPCCNLHLRLAIYRELSCAVAECAVRSFRADRALGGRG